MVPFLRHARNALARSDISIFEIILKIKNQDLLSRTAVRNRISRTAVRVPLGQWPTLFRVVPFLRHARNALARYARKGRSHSFEKIKEAISLSRTAVRNRISRTSVRVDRGQWYVLFHAVPFVAPQKMNLAKIFAILDRICVFRNCNFDLKWRTKALRSKLEPPNMNWRGIL